MPSSDHKQYLFFPGSFKPPHVGHFTLLKQLLPKVDKAYIIISPKPRGNITPEQSKLVWEQYLATLPPKQHNKVRLLIAFDPSPILSAFKIATKTAKPGDTIYLVKSDKNADNGRFDLFKQLKKIKVEPLTVPAFKQLSATNMREQLDQGASIEPFLPKKVDVEKVLKILKK